MSVDNIEDQDSIQDSNQPAPAATTGAVTDPPTNTTDSTVTQANPPSNKTSAAETDITSNEPADSTNK